MAARVQPAGTKAILTAWNSCSIETNEIGSNEEHQEESLDTGTTERQVGEAVKPGGVQHERY